MVYEVKCSNCGDVLNFGGKDPDGKFGEEEKIPENAMKFDGEVYCHECVREFVRFGTEDLQERLDSLETKVNNELG
jgi:ribosomal protein S27E